MVSLLVSWLISSVAVWITAQVLPGFSVKGLKGAAITAAILGILQVVLGWVLFAAIGIATLGLGFVLAFAARWLVTALLLVLTDKLADSLKIKSFPHALLGAIIISLITTVAERLL